MSWIRDVRAKLAELDQSRRALVRFSRTMAVALLVLGALVFFFGSHPIRGVVLAGIGVLFFLVGWLAPQGLKAVHRGWMTLAFGMGWIMSRVLLTIVFFVAVTPIGLIMRLVGKNPLVVRAEGDSYWIRRERGTRPPADYERLF